MKLSPDGPSVATIIQSPSARVEDSDLEIGRCGGGLRLLVAAACIVTLASAGLAFCWWAGTVDDATQTGYAAVAVVGALFCGLVWLLPGERGPVVVITSFGIRDLRIGNEFLVWESIAEVSAETRRGREVIVLKPTPALQRQLGFIHANPGVHTTGIVIDPDGLKTEFDTLLRACRACHAASRSGALLHEHEYDARERDARGFAVQAS